MSYASDALIDALKRENRQLKDEKEALERHIDEHCLMRFIHEIAYVKYANGLRDENAKLRKLVDGITFCSTTSSRSDDCIGCPLLDQSTHNYRCTKTECMQELGIEGADA